MDRLARRSVCIQAIDLPDPCPDASSGPVRDFLQGIKKLTHMPKFTKCKVTPYAEEQLDGLFAVANPWERLFMSCFLFTGMREQEVSHLYWRVLITRKQHDTPGRPEKSHKAAKQIALCARLFTLPRQIFLERLKILTGKFVNVRLVPPVGE